MDRQKFSSAHPGGFPTSRGQSTQSFSTGNSTRDTPTLGLRNVQADTELATTLHASSMMFRSIPTPLSRMSSVGPSSLSDSNVTSNSRRGGVVRVFDQFDDGNYVVRYKIRS